MSAPGTFLVWMLTAIVALPLSPCAFITSACCQKPAEATDEVAPRPARSCCAQHGQESERPAPKNRQKPCAGECCQLSPFAPTVEKVMPPAQPLVALLLLPPVDIGWVGAVVSPTVAVEPSLPLHVLHCQWRC
jgi:hypothetical protein